MIRHAIILAVVAGGARCTDTTGSAELPCGEAGCPTGLECVAATCVGDAAPVYPFALRIVPPDTTGLASAELGDLTLTDSVSSLQTSIQLVETIDVGGQVLGAENFSPPVRRILAVPLGGLAVQPLAVGGLPSLVNPARFSLALTPSWPTVQGSILPLGYRVRASFADLPPWEDELEWDTEEREVVVRLPEDDLVTLAGEVRALGLPIRDVRVTAVDEATGRQLSSEADTDAEGRFSVRLWPSMAEQSVLLRFASTDPDRPLPTHHEPVTAPRSGVGEPLLVELPVPRQSQRATLRVSRVVGEERVPGAGVDVVLRRAFMTGSHTVRGRTGADGTFSALAFPGEYQVDLRPSAGGPSRVTRLVVDFEDGDAEALLRPRTAIGGGLVDQDERPVADALIEATLLSAAWADETLIVAGEAPPLRRFETRTDADGQFLLNLDPGRHRLLVTPPEGSGQAPFFTVLEFQGEQPRTDVVISLPPAAVLSGTVVGLEEAPVGDARVDVWVQSDPPVRLVRGRTASDGSFQLRLPVRLQ